MANDKDPVFCAADIIKRAKLAKEFKTDSELAAFLGISRSTLSNWNARNSIDFPLLLGSLDDVDYNWLLTGKARLHIIQNSVTMTWYKVKWKYFTHRKQPTLWTTVA